MSLSEVISGSYYGLDGPTAANPGANVPEGRISGAGYSVWHNGSSAGTGRLLYNKANQDRNVINFGTPGAGLTWGGALNSIEAQTIDQKVDDGIADSGMVSAANAYVDGTGWITGCLTAASTASSASYVLTNTDLLCRMVFFLE